MNGEPTLKDIRDLIDGLAITTAKNFAEVKTKSERLEAKVDAGFAELKGGMRDMKAEMRNGFDRVSRIEGRIEALETK